MSEKNLIPELRFTGFEREWVERKLEEFFSSRREKGNSFLPIYSVSQSRGLVPRESLNRNIQKDAKPKDNLVVRPKDIAYNMMRMWQGAVGIAYELCMVSPAYVVLEAKNENSSLFFLYLFEKSRSKYLFTAYSYGLTLDRLRLYYKDFANIKLSAPNGQEQQKIASFLIAVDQRIQLLQKKKAKLEEYKNGVMQKLFSREIRFRDEKGNDFPDWEEKRLGDLYSFKSTNSFSREKLNYETGFVKNIHYGDIHTKFSTSFNITKEKVPYINPDLDLEKIADENYAQEGDLVIADASENYADIGKTIELIILDGQKVLAGLHTFLARRKDDLLVIGFGGHLMKNPYMRKEIYRIAQGSKVLSISSNRLSEVLVKIPIAFEQQKIAGFLSSLDQKIEQVGAQIEKMQVWKKGLLQKMFV